MSSFNTKPSEHDSHLKPGNLHLSPVAAIPLRQAQVKAGLVVPVVSPLVLSPFTGVPFESCCATTAVVAKAKSVTLESIVGIEFVFVLKRGGVREDFFNLLRVPIPIDDKMIKNDKDNVRREMEKKNEN